jgi:phospholipase D1/2
MTLAGPVVLDIVQHFVERWNEVKTRKVSSICRFKLMYVDADRYLV